MGFPLAFFFSLNPKICLFAICREKQPSGEIPNSVETFTRQENRSAFCIPLPIDQMGLCTPFCSIKWVPTTKWVCAPHLLVSTKWLHTPSDVLMLNVLLEWVCNPFCKNWSIGIVMYVARDGFYKMGAGNFHDQLIPNQPQKKSSIKWQRLLRGGSIYKMESTKWGGPTPPTLKTRWISILFCARPHPFCRGNWKADHFAFSHFFEKKIRRNLM